MIVLSYVILWDVAYFIQSLSFTQFLQIYLRLLSDKYLPHSVYHSLMKLLYYTCFWTLTALRQRYAADMCMLCAGACTRSAQVHVWAWHWLQTCWLYIIVLFKPTTIQCTCLWHGIFGRNWGRRGISGHLYVISISKFCLSSYDA